MVPVPLATIGKRDDFKGEFLAAQQTQLTITDQINRRGTDAREGAKRNQRAPDFAPVFVGNADGLHLPGSGTKRDERTTDKCSGKKCFEKEERKQPRRRPGAEKPLGLGVSVVREKRPVRLCRQATSSPAPHGPGARSARQEACALIVPQTGSPQE